MIRVYLRTGFPPGEAHAAGRELLEEVLGRRVMPEYGARGKPCLPGESLFFNISHSRSWVGVAVGSRELGFDLEEETRKISAGLCLRAGEPQIDPLAAWVMKESAVKWTGEGVAALRQAVLLPAENGFWRVKTGDRLCYVRQFNACGCVCAVAAEQPEEIEWAIKDST